MNQRIIITKLKSEPDYRNTSNIRLTFKANVNTREGGIIPYTEYFIVIEKDFFYLEDIKLKFLNRCLVNCDELILRWSIKNNNSLQEAKDAGKDTYGLVPISEKAIKELNELQKTPYNPTNNQLIKPKNPYTGKFIYTVSWYKRLYIKFKNFFKNKIK